MILLSILFVSCKKDDSGNSCQTSMKLDVSNAAPIIGEPFVINAPRESDFDIYRWTGPGYNETTNSNIINIYEAKYSNRGWYYCSKENATCNTILRDSIFIDVKLSQEPPPCNVANNSFSSSNLFSDVNFTSVTQQMDPTFNAMGVYGGAAFGYPSLRVLFNSYNENTEPIDGVYLTNDRLTFDVTQEYNRVSVSFLYNGNFFHCHPDQKLYVSHVNGKIRVSFCDMVFSNGSIMTTCKARMTEM